MMKYTQYIGVFADKRLILSEKYILLKVTGGKNENYKKRWNIRRLQ